MLDREGRERTWCTLEEEKKKEKKKKGKEHVGLKEKVDDFVWSEEDNEVLIQEKDLESEEEEKRFGGEK